MDLEIALWYIARGWAVLPCHGKQPLNQHGSNGATKDPEVVREWARRWPSANIGIATGAASGLYVIDEDSGGAETIAGLALPPTLTVRSGGGGRHFYFKRPPGEKWPNTAGGAGKGLGVGVDTRGDGGYVVAPPSIHPVTKEPYAWLVELAELAELPENVRLRVLAPKPRKSPPAMNPPRIPRGQGYANAALAKECEAVVHAPEGQRNHTLNVAAFSLGQLVGAGHLVESEVWARLTEAASAAGLEDREIEQTLISGVKAGMAEPRVIPERPEAPPRQAPRRESGQASGEDGARPGPGARGARSAGSSSTPPGHPAGAAESETDPEWTNLIVFCCLTEKFAFQLPDGRYDCSRFYSRDATRKFLQGRGIVGERLKNILAHSLHPVALKMDILANEPALVRDGDDIILNSWVPSLVVPTPGLWPRIERLFDYLTSVQGDVPASEAGFQWAMNWCARKVQNPGLIGYTAPVWSGDHGTGKSMAGFIIATILGLKNCANIRGEDIEGNHRSHFQRMLFIWADEVCATSSLKDTAGSMKAVITDATAIVNPKGVDAFVIKNRTAWFLASNSDRPVLVEGASDRRYAIFQPPKEVPEGYRDMLKGMFEKMEWTSESLTEIAAFAAYLLQRKVDFDAAQTPFMNQARLDLGLLGLKSEALFAQRLAADGVIATMVVADEIAKRAKVPFGGSKPTPLEWDCTNGVVAHDALFKAYEHWCLAEGYKHPATSGLLSAAIKRATGCSNVRARAPGKPEKQTLWAGLKL